MNMGISQAAEAAHGLWSWWSDEMMAMLPARLRGDPTDRDRFDILLSGDETTVESVERGEARRMIENCAFEDLPPESWQQIDELAGLRKPRLFLAKQDTLKIPVTLPRASGAQLRSALELQLPTLVPMLPDQIDWGYVEVASERRSISVILVVAKSSKLDDLELAFSEHGLMPPSFCVQCADKTVTLRKPLELARQPFSDRKTVTALVMVGMLAMIPVLTIGGAEILVSLERARVQRLEQDLAPKLAREKEAQREEKIRRAVAPLLHIPSASNILEALAQNLPATDWVLSSTQSADGTFEFVADMADKDVVEAALEKTVVAGGGVDVAEEIKTENLRGRVRYRMTR